MNDTLTPEQLIDEIEAMGMVLWVSDGEPHGCYFEDGWPAEMPMHVRTLMQPLLDQLKESADAVALLKHRPEVHFRREKDAVRVEYRGISVASARNLAEQVRLGNAELAERVAISRKTGLVNVTLRVRKP